jgi:hypothetical protein
MARGRMWGMNDYRIRPDSVRDFCVLSILTVRPKTRRYSIEQ